LGGGGNRKKLSLNLSVTCEGVCIEGKSLPVPGGGKGPANSGTVTVIILVEIERCFHVGIRSGKYGLSKGRVGQSRVQSTLKDDFTFITNTREGGLGRGSGEGGKQRNSRRGREKSAGRVGGAT